MTNTDGRLISSRSTFFYKFVFYPLIFAALAYVFGRDLPGGGNSAIRPFLGLLPIFVAGAIFLPQQLRFLKMADAVMDMGDSLLITQRGIRTTIPLQEVINVSSTHTGHAAQVVLTLRRNSPFGKQVLFIATDAKGFQWSIYAENPLLEQLIERVDAARRSPVALA